MSDQDTITRDRNQKVVKDFLGLLAAIFLHLAFLAEMRAKPRFTFIAVVCRMPIAPWLFPI